MRKALSLAALLCLHTPALAAEPEPPAQLVEAVARQESGQNPLAINTAGKSYYPVTRGEAEQLIQKAIAAGLSFDVGTMQINSWWMKRLGIDPLSLLDPATNERLGKWILAEEIARHGLNWKAVGKYHSPDPERGRRYAWLVYRHYASFLRCSAAEGFWIAGRNFSFQPTMTPLGMWLSSTRRKNGGRRLLWREIKSSGEIYRSGRSRSQWKDKCVIFCSFLQPLLLQTLPVQRRAHQRASKPFGNLAVFCQSQACV